MWAISRPFTALHRLWFHWVSTDRFERFTALSLPMQVAAAANTAARAVVTLPFFYLLLCLLLTTR